MSAPSRADDPANTPNGSRVSLSSFTIPASLVTSVLSLGCGFCPPCLDSLGGCVSRSDRKHMNGGQRTADRKRGAGGGSRTLTGLLSPADFLTDHGFRRPDVVPSFRIRFAVWTIPSPSPKHWGLRCCPSSLYTFPAYFSAGLGSGLPLREVPPTLSSSASPVSRRALKFFSSPLRLPFRHARVAGTKLYDRAGLSEFTGWHRDQQWADL